MYEVQKTTKKVPLLEIQQAVPFRFCYTIYGFISKYCSVGIPAESNLWQLMM